MSEAKMLSREALAVELSTIGATKRDKVRGHIAAIEQQLTTAQGQLEAMRPAVTALREAVCLCPPCPARTEWKLALDQFEALAQAAPKEG